MVTDPARGRPAPRLGLPVRPSSPLPPISRDAGSEEAPGEEEDLVTVERLWTEGEASEFNDHDIEHDDDGTATVSSRVESPASASAWKWSDDYLTALPARELGICR